MKMYILLQYSFFLSGLPSLTRRYSWTNNSHFVHFSASSKNVSDENKIVLDSFIFDEDVLP